MSEEKSELLALDVGERRIGVARANQTVGIPEPLAVIDTMLGNPYELIKALVDVYKPQKIVVGLPKSLHKSTESNQQSDNIQEFTEHLKNHVKVAIVYIDEALSTVEADKWQTRYPKAGEDSLAACVILERYMQEKINL